MLLKIDKKKGFSNLKITQITQGIGKLFKKNPTNPTGGPRIYLKNATNATGVPRI